MSNFTPKVKLEQRHELYAKTELPLSAKLSRPQFLSNDPLVHQIKDTSSPERPKSISRDPSQKLHLKKKNMHNEKKFLIPYKSLMEDSSAITTETDLYSCTKSEDMMQRKSCYCDNCGGISKWETKHSDLRNSIEDIRKSPSIQTNMTPEPFLEKRISDQKAIGSKSPKNDNLNMKRRRTAPKPVTRNNHLKSNEKIDSIETYDYYSSLSSFAPEESRRLSSNQGPKLVRREEMTIKEQFSIRDLNETDRDVIRQIGQMQNAVWPQRKTVIRPVKLKRDFGLSSIRAKRHELEKMLSAKNLPVFKSQDSNTIETRSSLFQKLYKDISSYNTELTEKTTKISTPVTSPLEKGKTKSVRFDSLKSVERDSVNTPNTSPKFKGFIKEKLNPLETRTRTEGDDESIELKPRSPENRLKESENEKKLKIRAVSPDKTLANLRSTKTTILKAYEKSPSSFSVTKQKEEGLLKRTVYDTHNIWFMPGSEAQALKFSFTDMGKETGEKNLIRFENTNSPEIRRPKRRDNTKIKPREEHGLRTNSFLMSKSNSLTIFPPLLSRLSKCDDLE